MLTCGDGSLYTGWTNHLAERVAAHQAGRGAKYTKSREPVELCYYEVFETKEEAMRREYAIKQMSRSEKLALAERKQETKVLRGMKGIIFDFNGTMLYDGKILEESWKRFLEEKTGRTVTEEDFQKRVHGRNADVTLRYFLGETLSVNELERLEEEKEVYYRELCLNSPDFHLAPGLPAFLDRLREEKIPFTIATAAGKNNVRFFFEHLNLERWFDPEQVVYNDGTLPGKPEPDLYLKAAGRLAISPEDCIIFEDSLSGIEAARRAGSRRIIGISSMKSEEELRQAGADEVWGDYEGAELSK